MKVSEIIRKHFREIMDAMTARYRTVLECKGQLEYKVYIWEDGEIECLQTTSGSNDSLVSRTPGRDLYYVTTVKEPFFDPWDCTPESKPDDDADRERMEAEIIDWCVDEYNQNLPEAFECIVSEQEQEEEDAELYP